MKNKYSQFVEILHPVMKKMRIQLGVKARPNSLFYYLEKEVCLELDTEFRILMIYNKINNILRWTYPEEELKLYFQEYMKEYQNIKGIIHVWN